MGRIWDRAPQKMATERLIYAIAGHVAPEITKLFAEWQPLAQSENYHGPVLNNTRHQREARDTSHPSTFSLRDFAANG